MAFTDGRRATMKSMKSIMGGIKVLMSSFKENLTIDLESMMSSFKENLMKDFERQLASQEERLKRDFNEQLASQEESLTSFFNEKIASQNEIIAELQSHINQSEVYTKSLYERVEKTYNNTTTGEVVKVVKIELLHQYRRWYPQLFEGHKVFAFNDIKKLPRFNSVCKNRTPNGALPLSSVHTIAKVLEQVVEDRNSQNHSVSLEHLPGATNKVIGAVVMKLSDEDTKQLNQVENELRKRVRTSMLKKGTLEALQPPPKRKKTLVVPTKQANPAKAWGESVVFFSNRSSNHKKDRGGRGEGGGRNIWSTLDNAKKQQKDIRFKLENNRKSEHTSSSQLVQVSHQNHWNVQDNQYHLLKI